MTEFNFDTVFDETMQTHNLDTVVILGHLNPDGDAAGSVMSLAHYIHVNYPQYRVFPYLANTMERGPKKMVVEDKTFVTFVSYWNLTPWLSRYFTIGKISDSC